MLEMHPATIEALVVRLEEPKQSEMIVEELRTLHAQKVLTVIDVMMVNRLPNGTVVARGLTELSPDEVARVQTVAKETLGVEVGNHVADGVNWEGRSVLLGRKDVQFIADLLRPGRAALALVFEHRWSARFGQLLHESGIKVIEDDLLTPDLLGKAGEGVSVW
jgi:hypothetical protein